MIAQEQVDLGGRGRSEMRGLRTERQGPPQGRGREKNVEESGDRDAGEKHGIAMTGQAKEAVSRRRTWSAVPGWKPSSGETPGTWEGRGGDLVAAGGGPDCARPRGSRSPHRTSSSQRPIQSKPTIKSLQKKNGAPTPQPRHSALSTQVTPARRTGRGKYQSMGADWDSPTEASQ